MTKVTTFVKEELIFADKLTDPRFKDLTGQIFDRLTVLGFAGQRKYGHSCWFVECSCGTIKKVGGCELGRKVKSCGCLNIELLKKRATHGLSKHPLFRVWNEMKERCSNPKKKSYRNYGGRGISVCDEWLNDFQAFYNWSVANGYKKGLQTDRRDNDGDYGPDNCRFVTSSMNSRNRRVRVTNKSGAAGVFKMKSGRYQASICVNKKQIYLGLHDTPEQAVKARNQYITENQLKGFNLAEIK